MEIIKQVAQDITYRGKKKNGKGFAIGQISIDVQNEEAFIWVRDNRHQVELQSLDKITPFKIDNKPVFENDILEFTITFKANVYAEESTDDETIISREIVTYNRETGGWYGVQLDGLVSGPYLPNSLEGAKNLGRKKAGV